MKIFCKKQSIIDELIKNEIWLKILRDTYKFSDDVDDFDLILHVDYDRKLVTRKCRAVLNSLLDKYADNGIAELESLQILKNAPFVSISSRKNIF